MSKKKELKPKAIEPIDSDGRSLMEMVADVSRELAEVKSMLQELMEQMEDIGNLT